jgi:hypothetical protein
MRRDDINYGKIGTSKSVVEKVPRDGNFLVKVLDFIGARKSTVEEDA